MVPLLSLRNRNTKPWSASTAATRVNVVRVASTTTISAMSRVMKLRIPTSFVTRENNNHRRYRAVSLEPYASRQYDSILTITSRSHTSQDRGKGDGVRQKASSAKVPSLTREILSLKHARLFACYRALKQKPADPNDEPMVPDERSVQMNLLRSRWPQSELCLDNCRVDVSTIPGAGYGVFTTKAIRRNELITLYPGDAVVETLADGTISLSLGLHIPESEQKQIFEAFNRHLGNPNDESDYNSESQRFMSNVAKAYRYRVQVNDAICMIGDPNRKKDSAYMGHMINDYCTVDIDGSRNKIDTSSSNDEDVRSVIRQSNIQPKRRNNNIDPTSSLSSSNDEYVQSMIRQYNIQSIENANCHVQMGIEECHVEIVANRDISRGEELFRSYGSEYWLLDGVKIFRWNLVVPSTNGSTD
jgi:SET domain